MESPGTPPLCPVPSASLCTCVWCVLLLSVPPSPAWCRARGISELTSQGERQPPTQLPSLVWAGHGLSFLDPERQGWKRTDSGARCGLGEETQLSPCDAACLLSWKPKPLSFEGPIKVQDIISTLAFSGRPQPSLREVTAAGIPRSDTASEFCPHHPSPVLAGDDSLSDHKSPLLSASWPPPLWK